MPIYILTNDVLQAGRDMGRAAQAAIYGEWTA